MPAPLPPLTASPVTLTARLERPVCPEGRPAVIALTVRNGGSEKVGLGGTAFDESAFVFTVTDGAGRAVPRTAFGERVLTPPSVVESNEGVALSPGRTRRYRFNLARLFDLSRPGLYRVSARRSFPSATPNRENALAVGPVTLRLAETDATRNGPIAPDPRAGRLYDYLYVTTDPAGGGAGCPTYRYEIGADGRPSPTLGPPTSALSGPASAFPEGRSLYAVASDGSVSAFRVGDSGRLVPPAPPAEPPTRHPSGLLLDPKGRFLFGPTGLLAVGKDGGLSALSPVAPTGLIAVDPSARFAYSPTRRYRLNARGQVMGDALETTRGRLPGPVVARNRDGSPALRAPELDSALAFTPSGRFAFGLGEKYVGPDKEPTARIEDRVLAMRVWPDGDLTPLPNPVRPCDKNGESYGCTNLSVDPTGRFLLVINPALNFIARYRIGPDGSLRLLGETEGGPDALLFGRDGHTLYALSQQRYSLSTLRLDDRGRLTRVGPDVSSGGFGLGLARARAPRPPVWGPASGGVEVSARLEREVFPTDVSVVLTVTLKNVSPRPLALGSAASAFRVTLTRFEGEPDPAPLAEGRELLESLGRSGPPMTLPPGGERRYRFVLSRLYDLSVAGLYTVQVSRVRPGAASAASAPLPFRVDDLGGPYSLPVVTSVGNGDQAVDVF